MVIQRAWFLQKRRFAQAQPVSGAPPTPDRAAQKSTLLLSSLRHGRAHERQPLLPDAPTATLYGHLFDLAQQHSAAVRADMTVVESTGGRTSSRSVKLDLFDSTLCFRGRLLPVWRKRLIPQ